MVYYKCILEFKITRGFEIVFVYGELITEEDYNSLTPRQKQYFLKQ